MQSADFHSTMRAIKTIVRPSFEIRLLETESGAYRVCYEQSGKEPHIGEPIRDYSLASTIFDLKLIELEGH